MGEDSRKQDIAEQRRKIAFNIFEDEKKSKIMKCLSWIAIFLVQNKNGTMLDGCSLPIRVQYTHIFMHLIYLHWSDVSIALVCRCGFCVCFHFSLFACFENRRKSVACAQQTRTQYRCTPVSSGRTANEGSIYIAFGTISCFLLEHHEIECDFRLASFSLSVFLFVCYFFSSVDL